MSSQQLTFRPALESEYPLVAEFKRQTFLANTGKEPPFPLDESYFEALRKYQSFSTQGVAFAMLNGKIIGNVEAATRSDAPANYGFVYNYYLVPEHRGKKFGEQLDAYAMNLFATHGFTHARLRTSPANAKAMDFYARNDWSFEKDSIPGLVFLIKKVPSGTLL